MHRTFSYQIDRCPLVTWLFSARFAHDAGRNQQRAVRLCSRFLSRTRRILFRSPSGDLLPKVAVGFPATGTRYERRPSRRRVLWLHVLHLGIGCEAHDDAPAALTADNPR